jgi:hypothetical protein
MSKYIALHDRDLEGDIPASANVPVVKLDEAVPLSYAFRAIRAAAAAGKLDSIFIVCHGIAGENRKALISLDAGGEGLMLGKEGLLHSNVSMWRAIRNTARNIVVYACAAADTQPGNEGTNADGRYLMGALALHTNADVYAADKMQWYVRRQRMARGMIDFGGWEGGLWRFPASGSRPEPAREAPTPIAQALSFVS